MMNLPPQKSSSLLNYFKKVISSTTVGQTRANSVDSENESLISDSSQSDADIIFHFINAFFLIF